MHLSVFVLSSQNDMHVLYVISYIEFKIGKEVYQLIVLDVSGLHNHYTNTYTVVYTCVNYNMSFALYLGSLNVNPSLVIPLINEITWR